MTTPQALAMADALDADPMVIGYDQAAALLRSQHAEIERKDAVLVEVLMLINKAANGRISRSYARPEALQMLTRARELINEELT